MEIRRVVTGHDDNGNSVFASDEMVAPVAAGTWVTWTCDETPGTRHRWLNPFDERCLWLGVMIGANHDAL